MSSQKEIPIPYTQGHNSHYVYAIIKKRVIKAALPNLQTQKGKGEVLFLIVLVILASFGGTMAGFQLDTKVVNPPYQIVGVCQPPALITRGGCFIVAQSTDSSGKPVTNYIPSGTYYLPNGTRYR